MRRSPAAIGWDADEASGGGAMERSGAAESMVWVPGGDLLMGSEAFYDEERPVHRRSVAGFWMDRHPVTNAEFRRFVEDTGHVTTAETAPSRADFPDASDDQLVPGSLVFTPPDHPVPLHDYRLWWSWVPGAQWRCPEGPVSTLDGLERHPVVHVSHDDVAAYAAWAHKELPTEAEWEYAARGGLVGATYPWGDGPTADGRLMANTWQGAFPYENLLLDGYARTSPVGAFPANGYGLVDMCGNVWEWTVDTYTADHRGQTGPTGAPTGQQCCGPTRPSVTSEQRLVVKGGSHLCAPGYCLRYRPAARQPQTPDTSTGHLGFRCLLRLGEAERRRRSRPRRTSGH
jgi:sulfatase modifying factor 1